MVAVLTLVVSAAPLAERAPDICRALQTAGWTVGVIATPQAVSWVDPAAVREATGRELMVDYRSSSQKRRGPRPDAVVACPATFNTVNKLAAGVADNYAMSMLNEALASRTRLLIVPMIGERLWSHPALSSSLRLLTTAGAALVDPGNGRGLVTPVRSGTGERVAGRFDPSWLTAHLRDVSAA